MGDSFSHSQGSMPLAAALELVAMQLEVAMQSAAARAEQLSASVAEFSAIGARLRAAGDPLLLESADAIEREAHRAMMAMQFHDQLAQRVAHVRDTLGDVHDELLSVKDPDWGALLRKMRAHYTMEDERQLFDMVLGALPDAPSRSEGESLASSVELF
jgi:hypothetical protein